MKVSHYTYIVHVVHTEMLETWDLSSVSYICQDIPRDGTYTVYYILGTVHGYRHLPDPDFMKGDLPSSLTPMHRVPPFELRNAEPYFLTC